MFRSQAQGDLSIFGNDPAAVIAVKVLGIFVIMVLMTLLTIWAERRVVGRMQMRIGPNRVGPFGLLQSLMDGIKLALKEEIIPKGAHLAVYVMAPVIAATTAFLTFAVIPLGPEVSIFGTVTPLQLTDFPVSVLYIGNCIRWNLRNRACWLVLRLDLPATWWTSFFSPDDQLRNCNGTFVCCGIPLCRVNVNFADCRSTRTNVVHRATTSVFHHLHNCNGWRN